MQRVRLRRGNPVPGLIFLPWDYDTPSQQPPYARTFSIHGHRQTDRGFR